MIFQTTGRVVDGFYVLGTNAVPSYLLDGLCPALFDAGMTFLGKFYENSARRVLGERLPRYLFVTHAHFDHLGAAAHLARSFPGLKIAMSTRAAQILERPGAIETICRLNEQAGDWGRRHGATGLLDEPFEPFEPGLVLQDGDEVDLPGGLTVRALATPGHTRDFLSYYIPKKKILVSSEASGCPDMTGYVFSEFLVDYDAYVESIKRLKALDVEVVCPGHYQVFTGEDARDLFGRSLRAAEEFRARVEELLDEEGGDIERVIERVRVVEYDPKPHPKQPEPAYLINTRARIEHLAARRTR
ncbi:MAG: MBL fold metallo-hydrolase [Deltaproteobacteria bacterium]|nr:MBL fold metallo-hydrolase [Deltaproteobacteria bacterium]